MRHAIVLRLVHSNPSPPFTVGTFPVVRDFSIEAHATFVSKLGLVNSEGQNDSSIEILFVLVTNVLR